jgi:HAD superfamily hydrolase (TIGR01549 family)
MQVGRKLEDVYEDLDPSQVDRLVELHRSFQEEHLELATPFAGAIEALTEIRDGGLAMAAVTSRSRRTLPATIEMTGLVQFFSAVIAAEDAPELKPHPAPLLAALAALGRQVSGAVMVGDSIHDVHAAQAAGIPAIAATYGFPGVQVLEANPDADIADISQLPALLLHRPY